MTSRRTLEASSEAKSPSVILMRQGKATILCIDDDTVGLHVRKLLLEAVGYNVIVALSGIEGLQLFRTKLIHAVILDYYMPGMLGGEVALRLKELSPATPIIMLSAYVALPDEVLQTVDMFIQKGQQPEILLARLREVLAVSQSSQSHSLPIPECEDNEL